MRYVGRANAIAAVRLEAVRRKDNDTGGQTVCDLKEYSSRGGGSLLSSSSRFSKAYRDSKSSFVIVRMYGCFKEYCG